MTTQEILFGSGIRKARASDLAMVVDKSERTVRRWKERPGLIQLDDLRILIRAQNIPDDQIIKLMRSTK